MQRISKVIKGDNYIPEYGYIVVTKQGMIIYNGQVGMRYSRKLTGERLCQIADTVGAYAIPEPLKFLKIISVLESITAVTVDEKNSHIRIDFAGRGEITIPVLLNLPEGIPHLAIEWIDMKTAKDTGMEISSLWNEMDGLTTTEGEALWGDVIGVYGSEGKLVSFDYGVYVHSDKLDIQNFYCPKALVGLGLRGMDYAVVQGEGIQLVGSDIAYICTGVAKSKVVEDMMSIKDDFEAGIKKKITLDFTSGVWRRAKLLVDAVLVLKIQNNQIFIECDRWKERIGKTEADDAEFHTRITLLERWASGTFKHAISVTKDGTWNLFGVTRGGMNFYGVLTDIAESDTSPKKNTATKEVVSELPDITEGESLL